MGSPPGRLGALLWWWETATSEIVHGPCDDFGPIKRLVSDAVSLESIRLGERGVRFAVLSTGHKATARGDDGEAFLSGGLWDSN